MKITIIAGARPNFMKIAPLLKAIQAAQLKGANITYRLVHTGQHYDNNMSGCFFKELDIPEPDVNLDCGGGSQAEQTASIMVRFENEIKQNPPTVVLVVGDVNSTMACAVTAKKLCINVVHVEAGLRSFDMTMPEEVNRMLTDSICDHFFTTSEFANSNLRQVGVREERIHFVGNTMIDALYQNLPKIQKPAFWEKFELEEKKYFLLTLHRPSNVDNPFKLTEILRAIESSVKGFKIIFPVHPRVKKMLSKVKLYGKRIIKSDPLGYHEFIYLIQNAKGIITDSGGITEEATILHIPCLTLRTTTERPETVSVGTNELVGFNLKKLQGYIGDILSGNWKVGGVPDLWDGRAADRIIKKLLQLYSPLYVDSVNSDLLRKSSIIARAI